MEAPENVANTSPTAASRAVERSRIPKESIASVYTGFDSGVGAPSPARFGSTLARQWLACCRTSWATFEPVVSQRPAIVSARSLPSPCR